MGKARAEAAVQVRPLEHGDLDAIVEVFGLSFPAGRRDELREQLASIFLDGPLYDAQLPALVAVDQSARVVGFRGQLVRHYRLGDQRLRARTTTHLMVHPELRRQGIGTAMRMYAREMPGRESTDFGFSDRPTEMGRAFGSSDETRLRVEIPAYGLRWSRILRPRARSARRIGQRLERRLRAPALRAAAERAGTLAPEPEVSWPAAVRLDAVELEAGGLRDAFDAVGESYALRLDEPLEVARWQLDYLRSYASRGRCRGVLLRDERRVPAGFYIAFLRPSRDWEVVAFAARPEHTLSVLVHALADGARAGAISAHGFATIRELRALLECGAALHPGLVLRIRNTREEVTQAFASAQALVTGLESERWL